MSGRESGLSMAGGNFSRASTPLKKSYKYRTVAHQSEVDDTLFKASAVKLTQKSKDEPFQFTNSPIPTKKQTPRIKTPLLTGMPRTRNQYRMVKHSPSYVDETLFGTPLPEPNFPAPWEKNNDTCVKGKMLTWSPPVSGSLSKTHNSINRHDRPHSGSSKRPGSAGVQQQNCAGVQWPDSAGAQRSGSACIQRPGSAGIQRPGSAGIQRPRSAGIQRPGSAGCTRPSDVASERLQMARNEIGKQPWK